MYLICVWMRALRGRVFLKKKNSGTTAQMPTSVFWSSLASGQQTYADGHCCFPSMCDLRLQLPALVSSKQTEVIVSEQSCQNWVNNEVNERAWRLTRSPRTIRSKCTTRHCITDCTNVQLYKSWAVCCRVQETAIPRYSCTVQWTRAHRITEAIRQCCCQTYQLVLFPIRKQCRFVYPGELWHMLPLVPQTTQTSTRISDGTTKETLR